MVSRGGRRGMYLASAAVALIGAFVIVATIIWGWGHLPYGLGIALTAIGCVSMVVLAIRNRDQRVVVGAALVAIIVTGGVVAVTGFSNTIPRWDDLAADGPGGWSARTGDLFIADGTAYDVKTGDVVWGHDRDDAKPSLVSSDIVVIGTRDETVGLETKTGRELWRSPITGRGIAHNGSTLVVAHSTSDKPTEAVALDLTTGKTVWRHSGRPVMECDLGPADRFSPAAKRSHVLLIPDKEHDRRAELLDLADGSTTVAKVDCNLAARVVGDVLLEADGNRLAGRSVSDGHQLWTTPIARTWSVEGDGATVFTPTNPNSKSSTGITAIDVTTGQTRRADPPFGKPASLSSLEVRRTAEVWILLKSGTGAALWNPASDKVVDVPNATSVESAGIDAFSGWMALSGKTQDFTGEETPQCWALSQSGQLYGPIPGSNCVVAEGLLQSSDGVFPLQ